MAEDSFGQKLSDASQVWWLVVELVGGLSEASTPSFTNAPSLPPVSSPSLGFGVV